jgi:hypothetical protein
MLAAEQLLPGQAAWVALLGVLHVKKITPTGPQSPAELVRMPIKVNTLMLLHNVKQHNVDVT